jgi:hypothetical protein
MRKLSLNETLFDLQEGVRYVIKNANYTFIKGRFECYVVREVDPVGDCIVAKFKSNTSGADRECVLFSLETNEWSPALISKSNPLVVETDD